MTTPFCCLARDAASITLQQTRKSAERMKIVHRQRAGTPTRAGLALTLKTIAAAEGAGMGFKLPPLSSVRVFEAAARHGSFKNAAEELNITASAVSHAVQNLEDWLGVELFRIGRICWRKGWCRYARRRCVRSTPSFQVKSSSLRRSSFT